MPTSKTGKVYVLTSNECIAQLEEKENNGSKRKDNRKQERAEKKNMRLEEKEQKAEER